MRKELRVFAGVALMFVMASAQAQVAADAVSAPDMNKLVSLVPEAKDFKLACALNPIDSKMNGQKIVYSTDKRSEITGEVTKVAYYLELTKADGSRDYVFVSTDPFSKDINQLGVPDLDSKAKFQQNLTNVVVKSNVEGVKNGTFADGCNIEFWGLNYGPANSAKIPDADDKSFDFGDTVASNGNYGSMQIHNVAEKQTLFAFNHWVVGKDADVGIGNGAPQKDWTFSKSAKKYTSGQLLILVQTK